MWHDKFRTNNGILTGVPSCDLFISGWSCKDLSLMSCNSGEEMTDYIRDAVTAYIDDMNKATPAYEGTTLPTLIGSMKYIYQHRPQFVLMENVIGANGLLDLIGQFFLAVRLPALAHKGPLPFELKHAELATQGVYPRRAR